ncbi:general stress protein [Pantoea agglomerans]|jgi:hypothetical protein|uniref:general stress protein n=1 Tax=Enterobacter agglomerans TaxID=549 RepID=UPI0009045834|nr:general stress protein [Pantoea agglomerans]MBN9929493.1 general stress protein [Pantoea agglomerans]MDH1168670.1 general stress protein [Pantoea agglomerans]NEG57452.1 stress-induced protein [Pantoea agglomerans]NEG97524.1 stress-induced protein [Pantoea agglomerans]NEH02992.1 stress-induced protein [Pantoea agglomerans]
MQQQRRGGSGNFAENPERAREAGRKGGKMSGGNFKNNPERAVEAGRLGGKISRRSSTDTTGV